MKRTTLTLALLVMIFAIAKAQTTDSAKTKETNNIVSANTVNQDSIYADVDQYAQFPGGLDNFYRFLGRNIRYPTDARDAKQQGRVKIQFVIEKNGSLSNIIVIRGVSPSIYAEAIRVLKMSPKWIPAKKNGEVVREKTWYPINFTLGG